MQEMGIWTNTSLVLIYMAVLVIFAFPFGYLLTHLKRKVLRNYAFFVRFPLYTTLGLLTASILLFATGYLVLNAYLVLGLFVVGLLLVIAVSTLGQSLIPRQGYGIKVNMVKAVRGNWIPLLLFFLSSFYFARVCSDWGWPPAGDSKTHGYLLSVILYEDKIPLAHPFWPGPFYYPIGFHVLGTVISFFSEFFSESMKMLLYPGEAVKLLIYPGEAVLITGALIAALIPSLLYSLIYIKTRSAAFSLLGYFSVYIIHPSLNLERWIVGYFYDGTFPFLLGVLAIITSFILFELWNSFSGFHKILIIIIPGMAILISYPNMFFFYTIWLAFVLLLSWRTILSKTSEILSSIKRRLPTLTISSLRGEQFGIDFSRRRYVILIAIVFPLVISYLSIGFIQTNDVMIFLFQSAQKSAYAYTLYPSFIYDNVNSIVMWISFVMAVIYLARKKFTIMNTLYLTFFIPTIYSILDESTYLTYLWWVFPERSVNILSPLAWIVLGILVHSTISKIFFSVKGRRSNKFFSNSSIYLKAFFCILITLLFSNTMITHLSLDLELTQSISRGQRETILRSDYLALDWIAKNVAVNDLILNDKSIAGRYILSFSIKNIVLFTEIRDERGFECVVIFSNPDDYELSRQIMEKWDVKYIFISGNDIYLEYPAGGGVIWQKRPWSSSQYIGFFSENPYIEEVFRQGNSGVYRSLLSG